MNRALKGSSALWIRWILRDIRARWIQVLSIAFVIALGTGAYSGLSSTTSWRIKSNDASFAITNMHDLKVSFSKGSFVPENLVKNALSDLIKRGDIVDVEERLHVPTQVRTQGKNGALMATGRLVGMDFTDNGPHIDVIHFTDRAWTNVLPGGQTPAVIDDAFATFNDLPDSVVLELPSGTSLTVVARGLSPEYFIPMDDSGFSGLNQGAFAVVYVPNETVQTISGLGKVINDVAIQVDKETDPEALRSDVVSMIEHSLPGYSFSISTQAEHRVHRLLYESADADQQFYHIIGLAILAGAVFAAFNLTSRIVQAQRREIGIGMALGTPTLKLAVRPLLIGTQISLLGVVLGIGIGILLNSAMKSVLETSLPLPVWITPFELRYYFWVALGGFIAPLIAIAMPVMFGLRVKPIEVIRAGHLAPVRKGMAPLMSKIPLPGNTFWQIPFRNLLRSPRRSILTLLAISVVIAVMISVLGMVDSFVTTLDVATRESTGDGRTRLEITLDRAMSADAPIIKSIEDHGVVNSAQTVLKFGATMRNESQELDLLVTAIDFKNSMWSPSVVKGALPKTNGEVLISTTAARNFEVTVGDVITVEYPVMTGPMSVKFVEDNFVISGVHPHPVRAYAYVDSSQLLPMGMNKMAQTVWINPTSNAVVSDVKDALFALSGVAAVFESSASDRATAESIEDQMGVLQIVQFVVLGLVLLIAFNTASINMDDRSREHSTMMAFGMQVRKIMRIAVLESAAMGLCASLIGTGLGILLLNYFVYTVFPTVIPDIGVTMNVSGETYAITLILGVVAVGIAPVLTVRKLLKTNIPSALKVLE